MVKARTKMIRDALPNIAITLVMIFWPIYAAIAATAIKYIAALFHTQTQNLLFL